MPRSASSKNNSSMMMRTAGGVWLITILMSRDGGFSATNAASFLCPSHHHRRHRGLSTIATPSPRSSVSSSTTITMLKILRRSRPSSMLIVNSRAPTETLPKTTRTTTRGDSRKTSNKIRTSAVGEELMLLDDQGHVNEELATSIWEWDHARHRQNDYEKKLPYGTRDALRLVHRIANQVWSDDGNKRSMSPINPDEISDPYYDDLIQDGMVALLQAIMLYEKYIVHADEFLQNNEGEADFDEESLDPTVDELDEIISEQPSFEEYASELIRLQLEEKVGKFSALRAMSQTNSVGAGLQLLENPSPAAELTDEYSKDRKSVWLNHVDVLPISSIRDEVFRTTRVSTIPADMDPSGLAVSDTIIQDEIATSGVDLLQLGATTVSTDDDEDSLRKDIDAWLQRTLTPREQSLMRLRFDLQEGDWNVLAQTLGLSNTEEAISMYQGALEKLRATSADFQVAAKYREE